MLENINNKMIEEITKLVNQMNSNLALEINKSIVNVYCSLCFGNDYTTYYRS